MRPAYRVYYTEYERGWGSRVDGFKDFEGTTAFEDATTHVAEFNAQNNLPVAPDWYMVASAPKLIDLNRI
jgi:hypothetical protein